LCKCERIGNAPKNIIFFLKEKQKMKKRRTLIISMLLIAALCLGIGYAAVAATDTLTIAGSASADGDAMNEQFDMAVYFSAVSKSNSKVEAEITEDADAPEGCGDNASFIVTGLAEKDETVYAKYTIKNDYEADVWVSLITPDDDVTDDDGCIVISHDLEAGTKIAKGATTTVTVTAKLVALSDEDVSIDNYTLQIKVSTEDPAASN
jgi:hypothetical protein